MNFLHGNAHLFHDVDSIFEGENDAFLRCADDMLFAVLVEVDAMNGATCFLVLQHTLRTVPEGQDADAGTADGSLCGQQIHIVVGDAFGSNGAFYP